MDKNENRDFYRHLLFAAMTGLMMALIFFMVLPNTFKSPSKQSFEYWSIEASPWRIASQYQVMGSNTQYIELENAAQTPLFLMEVSLNGTQGSGKFPVNPRNRFETHASKVLMVPIKASCNTNETYRFSLNITYALRADGNETQIQVGKFPVYGLCG